MVKSRQFILVKDYVGEPKKSDVKIVEETLPSPKDGEYIVEALYISVDPYMRMIRPPIGQVLEGPQVARVIESKNKNFPVGSLAVGYFGWRTHTLVTASFDEEHKNWGFVYTLPDIGNLSPSLGLGVLGTPGNTVYFGIRHLRPKEGETILISGAAGAVGSHVVQLAKTKGCKVIGLAGSDAKCEFLVKELGCEHAFNYKTTNLDKALKEHVPQGLDMFFDNVGGDTIDTVIDHMNFKGRVALCGGIASYSDPANAPKVKINLIKVLQYGISINAFHVFDSFSSWQEGIQYNLKSVREGKLKYLEHITEGFDNLFDAFVGVLRGANTGKAIVKVK